MPQSATDTAAPRLRKDARQQRIIGALRGAPNVRIGHLAAEFGVSTETIRRDLDELESRGLIERTYGGAVRPFGPEAAMAERVGQMVREREAMAAALARRIADDDVLMMGGGATTLHVARRLAAERRGLTVVTNAVPVASVLSQNPSFAIHMCPGRFDGAETCVFGAEAVAYLEGFCVNQAIVGASGLTVDGVTEAIDGAGAVYRAMMQRAAATTVVADHGKFERPALRIWARWREVAAVVTDAPPPPSLARALEAAGTRIEIAAPG